MMLGVVLTVIIIVVMGAVAFLVCKDEEKQTTARAKTSTAAPAPETRHESLEGVLVFQLVEGEISQLQYLRAMERIAVRDEKRHPLTVPNDIGPADA